MSGHLRASIDWLGKRNPIIGGDLIYYLFFPSLARRYPNASVGKLCHSDFTFGLLLQARRPHSLRMVAHPFFSVYFSRCSAAILQASSYTETSTLTQAGSKSRPKLAGQRSLTVMSDVWPATSSYMLGLSHRKYDLSQLAKAVDTAAKAKDNSGDAYS